VTERKRDRKRDRERELVRESKGEREEGGGCRERE